jgi:hypothetical protein
MSLSPLVQQEATIRQASDMRPADATRFLFDHYRAPREDSQDSFVLALIGTS